MKHIIETIFIATVIVMLLLLGSCSTIQPIFKVDAGYSKFFVFPDGRARPVSPYRYDRQDCPAVDINGKYHD